MLPVPVPAPRRRFLAPLLKFVFLLAASAAGLSAQTAATGGITGRVFNTATGEYVRNAEVSVTGTGVVAYTEDGGVFQLANLPAGDVTVVVRYTGLQETTAVVPVAAGRTVTHDFQMAEAAYRGGDQVIHLEKFAVAGTRSGQAKAIMERRASLNAKNVVASDNYGSLTMGDVGEFMKSMPGLSLDYVEVDTSAVRIGGLDPKYSTFTMDGAGMPTGTSNNNTGRQNSFEQMSITGIESIEFNNTLTANMDADAPGGNINLKSKYAFDRKRRQLVFQLGGINTTPDELGSEYFPDDRKHGRTRPSGQIGYGDVFFNGRLGVEVNLSDNSNFVEQDRHQLDWIYPTTLPAGVTADNGGVPYRAMWRPGPKMTRRQAANLSADYKLTDRITLSLRGSFSDYFVEYVNQYSFLYFGSTSASNLAAGSTVNHLVASTTTNTRAATEYSHRAADTPVVLVVPKIEYKGDTFKATLRGSYSQARYNFRDAMRGFFQRDDSAVTNLGTVTLDRDSSESVAWTMSQATTSAAQDWHNPDNWKSFGTNNVRNADSDVTNERYSGNLDIEKSIKLNNLPVKLLGGAGIRSNSWNSTEGGYKAYTIIDASGAQATSAVPYNRNYQLAISGFDAGNFNDQGWRSDSNYGTYQLFQQHPEYFAASSAGNLQRRLANTKGLQETISAGYLEAQTKWKRFRADLGLRYENTKENVKIWNLKTASQVIAAGYTVVATSAANGLGQPGYVSQAQSVAAEGSKAPAGAAPGAGFASTTEGLLYQYGKQAKRSGSYDDWFKSGGLKYDFTPKLTGQFAFSDSILRPDYGNLAGAAAINDQTLVVTVPNSQLKPEHSTKFYAGLQYFLEPSGVLGISAYRLKIKDMQVTGIQYNNPADVGYDANEYAGYTFISAANDPQVRYTNGVTGEYSQQLTFLPGMFKGLGVYGSLTRVIADGVRVNTPTHSANWGLKYHYGPFTINVNGTWNGTYRTSALSATPTTVNGGVLYHAPRQIWSTSATYKLTRNFSLMVAGRNIFNSPDIVYSNIPSHVQQYTVYGPMWTAAISGSF